MLSIVGSKVLNKDFRFGCARMVDVDVDLGGTKKKFRVYQVDDVS